VDEELVQRDDGLHLVVSRLVETGECSVHSFEFEDDLMEFVSLIDKSLFRVTVLFAVDDAKEESGNDMGRRWTKRICKV
jgi:hypothetical protein